MKYVKRDTDMLVEAYSEVLLCERNWKKMLAAGAVAATMGTANAPNSPKFGEYTPKQTSTLSDNIFANKNYDYQADNTGESVAINSITQVISDSLDGVASDLVVSVIKQSGTASGSEAVVFEVVGTVLAHSQEEADSKTANIISSMLKDRDIKVTGLTDTSGRPLNLENTQQRFKVKIRVGVDLRSVDIAL
jgi:hypothetical protein